MNTIADWFEEWSSQCLEPGRSPEQLHDIKRAFYAGAASVAMREGYKQEWILDEAGEFFTNNLRQVVNPASVPIRAVADDDIPF